MGSEVQTSKQPHKKCSSLLLSQLSPALPSPSLRRRPTAATAAMVDTVAVTVDTVAVTVDTVAAMAATADTASVKPRLRPSPRLKPSPGWDMPDLDTPLSPLSPTDMASAPSATPLPTLLDTL